MESGHPQTIKALRQAVEAEPGDSDAHAELGLALRRNGDYDGAVEAYREALRLDPAHAQVHSYLGSALRTRGEFDAAIASHLEAVRLEPESPTYHYNLGLALYDARRYSEAVTAFGEALARSAPEADNYDIYDWLGRALGQNGEPVEAVAAFETAIRLNPEYAPAYTGLGVVLTRLDRYADALAADEQAVRLAPDDALAQYNLGLSRCNADQPELAEEALRTAIRLQPDYADAHYELGVVLEEMGRVHEARLEWEQALRFGSGEIAEAAGEALACTASPARASNAFIRRLDEILDAPLLGSFAEFRRAVHGLGETKKELVLRLAMRGLSERGLVRDQAVQITCVRVLAALLPTTPDLVDELLNRRSHRYDFEVHFTLFVYLKHARKMLKAAPRVVALTEQYLRHIDRETAHAAWMAGDLLGEHWPIGSALPVLIDVAAHARYAAGRWGALRGLRVILQRPELPDESRNEISALLESLRAKDRSRLIRSEAETLLERIAQRQGNEP